MHGLVGSSNLQYYRVRTVELVLRITKQISSDLKGLVKDRQSFASYGSHCSHNYDLTLITTPDSLNLLSLAAGRKANRLELDFECTELDLHVVFLYKMIQ